jgi:signal peptidase I
VTELPTEQRRRRRARSVAWLLLQFAALTYLTAAASLLFWSHAPELIGWHPRVVLTGSMMPVIEPGDVAVIGPAAPGPWSLPKGRIVLVRDPLMRSGFYLHRVLSYDDAGRIITKGDANLTPDTAPVTAGQVLGQLRLLVPVVGRPVVWLQDRNYLALALAGLGTWGALSVIGAGPVRGHGRGRGRDRGTVGTGDRTGLFSRARLARSAALAGSSGSAEPDAARRGVAVLLGRPAAITKARIRATAR